MICLFRVFTAFALVSSLKAKVDKNDVTFYLFTKEDSKNFLKLENTAQIRTDTDIVFLIHGWTENRTTPWYEDLKNAYLSRTDKNYNVIQVDWAKIAAQSYPIAARDTRQIGEVIADFIVSLVELGFPLEKIHVCGHSLGGQVAGFTGKQVFSKTSKKLPRITALDPAGPFFQGILVSYKDRLNRFDADVVLVIHTDRTVFGFLSPCGTIDVFPNGGAATQPGCPFRGDNIFDRWRWQLTNSEEIFCSHHRSYEYFEEAVQNPGTFIATECYSYSAFDSGMCKDNKKIDIAGDLSRTDDGNYYLYTNPERPFAQKSQ